MSRSSASKDFPPAPWVLRGQIYGSMWMVPAERIQFRVDPTFELLTFAGRVCVVACFVDYQEGSVLTYGELFGAVSVRTREPRHRGLTVTHMWVDSERSMRGGRALWGMPKEMARFEFDHHPPEGAFRGIGWDSRKKELARMSCDVVAGLPDSVRIPMSLPNLQMLDGKVQSPKTAIHFSPRLMRTEWSIPEDSPLASLGISGASPWMSFQVRNFEWNLPAATPVD
ncbi:acetoacetate decarboxylase family protein [Archangium lipolyticum]|uniref:acetoacetate decarboxylase family protein n=1 Tax=Archangium lipolyticum TaxID=2970465 RepID=UPI00214A2E0A|nr:acetoacetate decarboxylase family protein [Archangium lipolyticum]